MIHFVIGTRAQLFKMAPIMMECEKRGLEWRWIYTAQHRDTIENTAAIFGLGKPDYTVFEWDTEAKTIKKMGNWLIKIMLALPKGKKILAGYTGKNNVVLTHGDTFTTWWGALLGRLNRCRVMHVESGLRSFHLTKPFPEEINRLITFRLSNIYAAPGDWALGNLKKYKGDKINTGQNTQIDVLQVGIARCSESKLKVEHKPYAIASIHRYENIFKDDQFEMIIDKIVEISKKIHIYWVQHPATKERLIKMPELAKKLEASGSISPLPRLDYLDFMKLVRDSAFVITDGGGNQEELYVLGKPTLLFREETERQEGLGENAVLSKFNPDVIDEFVTNYKNYERPMVKNEKSPSKMIVDYLDSHGYGKKS